MNGKSISHSELMTLFEAARWAPSSGNNQPWRFVYSTHRAPMWQDFLKLLDEGNKEWCTRAAALVLVCSKTTFDYNEKPSPSHAFDCGAAFENLAIQGVSMGLVVHPMEGFNKQQAKLQLSIPGNYELIAMVAIGRPGKLEDLSDKNKEREFPKGRKSIKEIASKEKFIWQ